MVIFFSSYVYTYCTLALRQSIINSGVRVGPIIMVANDRKLTMYHRAIIAGNIERSRIALYTLCQEEGISGDNVLDPLSYHSFRSKKCEKL